MSISVLADEDTVLGFKLAGVKNSIIFEESKLEEQVLSLRESKILVVTESIGAMIREKNMHNKIDSILVEIPDKEGSKGTAMDNIALLFEQAVGVQLKK